MCTGPKDGRSGDVGRSRDGEIVEGILSTVQLRGMNGPIEERGVEGRFERGGGDGSGRNDVADRITAACKVANITSKLDSIL